MSDEQVVVGGDLFLRVTRDIGRGFDGGEVLEVVEVCSRDSEARGAYLLKGDGARFVGTKDNLLTSGDWRRVPPGYVVPPIGDLLAGVERLVVAYRAMLADPETGAAGVDATVRQMAAMAGIEVGA